MDLGQVPYLLQSLKGLLFAWKPAFYTFTHRTLSVIIQLWNTWSTLGEKQRNKKTTYYSTWRHQAIPVYHSKPSFGKYVMRIKNLCKAFTLTILQKWAYIAQTNAFHPLRQPLHKYCAFYILYLGSGVALSPYSALSL